MSKETKIEQQTADFFAQSEANADTLGELKSLNIQAESTTGQIIELDLLELQRLAEISNSDGVSVLKKRKPKLPFLNEVVTWIKNTFTYACFKFGKDEDEDEDEEDKE